MNYQAIYAKLMRRYRLDPPLTTEYSEVHHIVPRCMGGSDDLANLVALPARVHFVAHQILARVYPDNEKLAHAAFRMSNFKRYGARKYSWLKTREARRMAAIDRRGDKNPMYGKRGAACPHFGKKYPERGKKVRETLRGRTLSQETKKRISQARKGYIVPQEVRDRMSLSHIGKKCRPMSDEQKLKLSLAARGRIISEETKAKMRGPRGLYKKRAV